MSGGKIQGWDDSGMSDRSRVGNNQGCKVVGVGKLRDGRLEQ